MNFYFRNNNGRKAKVGFNTSKKVQVTKKSQFQNGKVQDARQKIISKKRKGVKDARDILAKMAKTQDARNKLDKIREGRTAGSARNSNVKVIGNNIVRKTDRNGKISLSTNKPSTASSFKLAIQRELGLAPPARLPRTVPQIAKRVIPSVPQVPRIPRNQLIAPQYQYEPVYDELPTRSLYKWANPAASLAVVERPVRRTALNRSFENFSVSR